MSRFRMRSAALVLVVSSCLLSCSRTFAVAPVGSLAAGVRFEFHEVSGERASFRIIALSVASIAIDGSETVIWSLDGRYRVTLRPESVPGGFSWNHVLTVPLASGQHSLRALVSRGSGIDALRVIPRRSSDADYVRALEKMHPGACERIQEQRGRIQRPSRRWISGSMSSKDRCPRLGYHGSSASNSSTRSSISGTKALSQQTGCR